MSDILQDTATAIFGTLAASSALTGLLAGTASIYNTAPPENPAFDYIIFSHSGGGPENQTQASLESNLWLVRAYSSTSMKTAAAIFNAFDALLDRKTLTIGTRKVLHTWRETNVATRLVEPTGASVWCAGAYYRVRTTGV